MLSKTLLTLALLSLAAPAWAAGGGATLIGKYGNWSSFSMKEGEDQVCYMTMTAQPVDVPKQGKKAKRGKIVLMITHRPAESSLDVVSYTAGIKLKPASDMELSVGAKKFALFTQTDTAWSRDPATDHALTTAIRSGTTLMAKGTSVQDAPFQDALALKGASQAYAAMSKACGINVPEPAKEKPAATPKKVETPKKPAQPKAPVVKKKD